MEHIMVDRRQCMNIRDGRRIKGAETETDILVGAKIRLKIRAVKRLGKVK